MSPAQGKKMEELSGRDSAASLQHGVWQSDVTWELQKNQQLQTRNQHVEIPCFREPRTRDPYFRGNLRKQNYPFCADSLR